MPAVSSSHKTRPRPLDGCGAFLGTVLPLMNISLALKSKKRSMTSVKVFELSWRSGKTPVDFEFSGGQLAPPSWLCLPEPHSSDQPVVDTGSPCLLRQAWAAAAERVLRRPPGVPQMAPSHKYIDTLAILWPDWLRILMHLSVEQSEKLEGWSATLLHGDGIDRLGAMYEILDFWKQQYPSDYRALLYRLHGRSGELLEEPEKPQQPKTELARFELPNEEAGHEVLDALTCALIWRKGLSSDARPGLLEAQWVSWPSSSPPQLVIRLCRVMASQPIQHAIQNDSQFKTPDGKSGHPTKMKRSALPSRARDSQ